MLVRHPFFFGASKGADWRWTDCYKGQANWDKVLGRYTHGGGTLLDLEFLEKNGRRVAAFGYWAGFAYVQYTGLRPMLQTAPLTALSGAALALENWAWQLTRAGSLPGVESYPNEDALVSHVKEIFAEGKAKAGRFPRVIVIGALGRCGRGAVDMCLKAGIPTESILKWDLDETKAGGPFQEVAESDIFVNCIYLSTKIPPFVTVETLQSPDRKLSVVCDVSADSTNPLTPGKSSLPPPMDKRLTVCSSHLHRHYHLRQAYRPGRRPEGRPASQRHQHRPSPLPAPS